VNPLATLPMMASVAMVIVYLYGELWILGLRFNECALQPFHSRRCMLACRSQIYQSTARTFHHSDSLAFASVSRDAHLIVTYAPIKSPVMRRLCRLAANAHCSEANRLLSATYAACLRPDAASCVGKCICRTDTHCPPFPAACRW